MAKQRISANQVYVGVTSSNGQVLTSNGTVAYWANSSGGFSNGQTIYANTINATSSTNGQVLISNGTSVSFQAIYANTINATSSTNGQVLISNGTSVSWGVSQIATSDTKWKYRLLRCDFEGANNDTSTFNYVGFVPVGLSNNAIISTSLAKFGSSSLLCAGGAAATKVQCAITLPTNIGTSNFTLEGWVYPTSFTNNSFPGIFDLGLSTTVRVGLYFASSTTVGFRLDSTTNTLTTSTIGINLNAWNHIAIERVNGSITLYVNGVSAGSYAYTTSILNTWILYIGSTLDGYPLQGNIDDVRMTIGNTVYGSAFSGSVPSAAFPIGPYVSFNNGPIL